MDEKLKKILPIVLAVVLAGTGIVLSSRFVSESNTVHKEPEIVTEIYVPDTAVPLRELKYIREEYTREDVENEIVNLYFFYVDSTTGYYYELYKDFKIKSQFEHLLLRNEGIYVTPMFNIQEAAYRLTKFLLENNHLIEVSEEYMDYSLSVYNRKYPKDFKKVLDQLIDHYLNGKTFSIVIHITSSDKSKIDKDKYNFVLLVPMADDDNYVILDRNTNRALRKKYYPISATKEVVDLDDGLYHLEMEFTFNRDILPEKLPRFMNYEVPIWYCLTNAEGNVAYGAGNIYYREKSSYAKPM